MTSRFLLPRQISDDLAGQDRSTTMNDSVSFATKYGLAPRLSSRAAESLRSGDSPLPMTGASIQPSYRPPITAHGLIVALAVSTPPAGL